MTMFGAHSKYITKVLLSPDVKCVLSCPFLSGTQELSFPSILKQGWSRLTSFPSLPSLDARFAPRSRHLATCSADKTIKIWSTENFEFKLERVLEGHQRWVWDCAFSADSAYLVSGPFPHPSSPSFLVSSLKQG